ncbi:HTH domain-containing protein [Legionella pneumophila]|uniref:HTH domain-containing protein n=1 Tax=Legionella pneumophila TaxID=446 RepID=UPI001A279241|nr:HTH domain-containing protein [Legionella pneumophila]HAT9397970.1 hypothetical protein [Legionella pneumophila subsp. pneumophila]MCW8401128.1 HTH domain-containing protein [Legionella pneumophila]MCZ4698212.1 HTH domain-containing protein [Legionella pneumophila]MCZ4713617.1 HTH domain-containing protein [Legionella pneumophila]MCZ4744089.1 HTH domain-containing protein [Legionella pneumophila]
MNTFKDIAYQILKECRKPLHSTKITEIALKNGWLKTAGKTPHATMNAQLIVDINTKKEVSRFKKVAPSIFALNEIINSESSVIAKPDKIYNISPNISSRQKGDIAEARIAELITLYGDTSLSCYKPISDDEGIDLIVKQKGSLKSMYIQVKSRYGDNPSEVFVSKIKTCNAIENHSMAFVFCLFDTEKGDVWDYVWFIPAPAFIKHAHRLDEGRMLGFVAGRNKKESNKWDEYLIDKRDLANQIISAMKLYN